jgi:probable HAF family extracellular repeat protein
MKSLWLMFRHRVLGIILLVGVTGSAEAVSYVYTQIDVPGANRTEAYGINNNGQIVGSFFDDTGQYGFLKDGDNYTIIDVAPSGTDALGLNDVLQIVGYADNLGFVKDGNIIEPIDIFSSSGFTVARDINNTEIIVGNFNDVTGTHGFVKDGESVTPVDGPNALYTEVTGINDNGDIVGNYISPGGQFIAFTQSGSIFSVVDVPGATVTGAHGINLFGQIVGTFRDSNDIAHGFVMNGAEIYSLDVAGAVSANFTQARGINDFGSVVGWFDGADGMIHGFLATPVPVPATAWLFTSGLLGLVGISRRKKAA